MLPQQQIIIPRRTSYALTTTVYTSPWAASWDWLYRQTFWLADGQRDVLRMAILLHKTEAVVEKVVMELTVTGYTSIHI